MSARCDRCDKPIATDADWATTPEGEGEGLCWGWGTPSCASVDWRARALAAEAERDALRAIVEGRTVAPTMAEARAVRGAGGAFVRSPVYLDGFHGRFAEVVTGLARLGSESEDQRRAVARWVVIGRDGRPCAWPVVVSRG